MKKYYQQIEIFIRENEHAIYRLAYSYTKNQEDALDVIQDSIVKALRRSGTLKSQDQLRGWFYRILINTAIDHLRKQKKIMDMTDETLSDLLISDDKILEQMEVSEILDYLPLQYKSILHLRFFEELKIETIAQVLNLNINTVKTRLYKALTLLRIQFDSSEKVGENE